MPHNITVLNHSGGNICLKPGSALVLSKSNGSFSLSKGSASRHPVGCAVSPSTTVQSPAAQTKATSSTTTCQSASTQACNTIPVTSGTHTASVISSEELTHPNSHSACTRDNGTNTQITNTKDRRPRNTMGVGAVTSQKTGFIGLPPALACSSLPEDFVGGRAREARGNNG